ncbi:Arc family DNA-binding protein [Marinobacterium lutimaris]|uniref:Arc-like DNA binding domain-containing protein n=1 Tax=Marinobacterium lutimaris TaxID=568106 RepID=A0A1H5XST9_9GAMM|nr:Arc family DNA-binding protein [Marinobacterium lutimaris]SEG14791.1 Arc-like DNA binding domain-containing protein [Marinobacterium lutimaris]
MEMGQVALIAVTAYSDYAARMENQYPSHALAKFQIRLSHKLREQLRIAADENNRSINAEVVKRLEETMHGADFIPATDAATLAEKAKADQTAALRHAIACAIRDTASAGHRTATVKTDSYHPDVLKQIIQQLRELGYDVSSSEATLAVAF